MKPLTDPVITVVSVLAIAAQVVLGILVLLCIAALFSPGARRLLDRLRDRLAGSEIWIAFAVALVATAGSLFFQLYSEFQPCPLCWIQRAAMYPLVLLLPLVAVLSKGKRWPILLVGLLPVAGIIVASLHRVEEATAANFCSDQRACEYNWLMDRVPLEYITIPTLSLTAFALIIAFLLFAIFPPGKAAAETGR